MIAAIVLAAGRSRRMGTQKLLLPFGDRPLIAHVVDQLLRSPVDRVYVVIAPEGQGIVRALGDRDVYVVTNPDSGSEMLQSVRCGLRAIPEQAAAAALVVPGDQPGVNPDHVAQLVRAWQSSERGIAVPAHEGRRGHPLLVAMRYRQQILSEFDGVGLRGLLEAHPNDILELHMSTKEVLEDMDWPEDYRRLVPERANDTDG
jgi:molybdenum cofactor cytidylyltransferase